MFKTVHQRDTGQARTTARRARDTTSIHAGELLTLLRRHDIPCWIDSFSSNGWTARLGSPASGFYAQQGYFRTLDAAATWLLEEARHHFSRALAGRD